ncbi:MAG: hypothetical protein LBM01_03705 [Christensenellaceae bacterium]|jgi:DNA ligase-1|nr:hypothetical protein [Christensenellaceae bacterium]
MLTRFLELSKRLSATASRLEKEAILAEFKDDAEVLAILDFLYNPFIVSGISDKKLVRAKADLFSAMSAPKDFRQVLEYFKAHNTGRDEDVNFLVSFADGFEAETRELIFAVITKSLKLGVADTTLNKVFGADFIPKFNVMLAENYNEENNQEYVNGKEFLITEKFDGVRCMLIFSENGEPTFFSRQGKALQDMVELIEESEKLDKNFVYDGELLLKNDENLIASDNFRATVKITSSDNIKKNLFFNIFDKVLKTDILNGESSKTARERKQSYIEELTALNLPHFIPAPILYEGTDISKIMEFCDKLTAEGKEGVMINIADAPYECKRTKNLLKVKKFHTADVLCEGIEEGGGANKGKLGAAIVKFTHEGAFYTCKVGSGFKQDEREYFWENKNEIVGHIIEIGYFEITKNQNDDAFSLRFPTFKCVRNDKDEISMH